MVTSFLETVVTGQFLPEKLNSVNGLEATLLERFK